MNNTNVIALKAERNEYLKLAAEINKQLPQKETSEQIKNRRNINKAQKERLLNFIDVYVDVKKNIFKLSNRCTQANIFENKQNIFDEIKNNATDKTLERINGADSLDFSRLEKVMTNVKLLQFFMSANQRNLAAENKKAFSAAFIIDLLAKIMLMSAPIYERTIKLYKEKK
jgi:hypothetical protein